MYAMIASWPTSLLFRYIKIKTICISWNLNGNFVGGISVCSLYFLLFRTSEKCTISCQKVSKIQKFRFFKGTVSHDEFGV